MFFISYPQQQGQTISCKQSPEDCTLNSKILLEAPQPTYTAHSIASNVAGSNNVALSEVTG